MSETTITHDLTARIRSAADYLAEHGWTQGTEQEDDGSVCLTGAIRHCAPQTGDEHLIRQVLAKRGRAEEWNDDPDRSEGEVLEFLRTVEVTDADLADTFGPQWEAVVALVRRAATLTDDEASALVAAGDAAGDAARDAAGNAALNAARYAAWDAAGALATRDLIGNHGYTADDYRTLTGPWASVIGAVHPDDERDGLYVGGAK